MAENGLKCFLQDALQFIHVCASMSVLLPQYFSLCKHTHRPYNQLTQQDAGDDAFSEAGAHVRGESVCVCGEGGY